MNMFLVGSEKATRDFAHPLVLKLTLIMGIVYLGACGVFNFFFPGDFDIHPTHLSDSFLMVIFAAAVSFFSTIVLFFERSRIGF